MKIKLSDDLTLDDVDEAAISTITSGQKEDFENGKT
jgi:hypothetical protein